MIRFQRQAKVSKQTTLLDGVAIGQPKWRMCGHGLNRSVLEGMEDISNVKIHLRTCSGNVNIGTPHIYGQILNFFTLKQGF